MEKKSLTTLLTFVIFLMTANAILAQDNKPNSVPSPEFSAIDQSIYVITKNRYAEGFEQQSAKFTDLIMIEIIPANVSSKKQNSYEVGKLYKIFSGGEFQGSVKVDKIVDLQCDSNAAVVKPTSSTKIPADGFVLATNSKIVKSHRSNVSALSPGERTQVLNLVMEEFKKRMVNVKNVSDIKIKDIRSTQLLPDSEKSVVGSFFLKSSTSLDRVFLIASPVGNEFKTTLVKYNHSTDLQDGKDDEPEIFVDQLDINGDGNDEVITQVTGYENEEFWVYKRNKDGWIKIWIGGVGGC